MRLRLRLLPTLVMVVGMVMSVVVGITLDRASERDLETRLNADAQELAMLLQGLAGTLESSLTAVAGIGLVTDGDVATIEGYLQATGVQGTHVFLHLDELIDDSPTTSDIDFTLVSTNGPGANSSGIADEDPATERREVSQLLRSPAVLGHIGEVASAGGFALVPTPSRDALILLAVATDGTHAYGDMQRFPLGAAGLFLVDQLGSIDAFAVYSNPTPSAETAVMASTAELPLTGERATTTFDVGSQELLVEVAGPRQYLIPPVAAGALVLLVAAAIATALWHARRQRDAAVVALDTAREADRRFRAALNASPDAVLLWDATTGRVSLLNRDDFFGHALDQGDTTADVLALIPEDDRPRLTALVAAGGADGTGVDTRVTRPDGSEAWAHLRLSRIGDSTSGEAGNLVVVATDISETRRVQQQRAQLEADLNQAQRMETIGQLAGGIAHDFNNLLAAISSTAELLASDATDPDTMADLQEILAATHRGAALTRRLLAFSRRGVSTHDIVDVDAVVTGVADLMRRMIDERIDLDIQALDRPLPVQGDSGEIEQILFNLVVNARDAVAGPGHLITVRTDNHDGCARIVVEDNGVGMPAEIRERAFEPFFTTKDADRGTGLGLSIVYGIASRMNGTVTIDSTMGAGTTVTVELPLAEAPAPAPSDIELSTQLEPLRTGERVLLVEDEPAVCRAAQRLLERAGHQVRSARDGREALDVLEDSFDPTVLVTDVILPGPLTGRDIADRARALHPGIRVVYASGYPREVITSDQLIEEHVAFVAKPFTSQALLTAVADRQEAVR